MRNKHFNHEVLHSDIFSHVTNMRYMPHWLVLGSDLMLCIIAFIISYLIGHDFWHYYVGAENISPILSLKEQCGFLLGTQLIFFWLFHTYSGIIRYTTFVDMIKVLLSIFCTCTIILIINRLWLEYNDRKLFFNTLIALYAFVSFALIFCSRVGIKTLFESMRVLTGHSKKVLIYGTQAAGIAIAKMLKSSVDMPYRAVGFIDDDPKSSTYELVGLRVYKLNERLFERMKRKGISSVIVSPKKMADLHPNKDLRIFLDHNIHLLTTPHFTDWETETNDSTTEMIRSRVGSIDAIQVEDLLERPTISINTDNVNQTLRGKVVMVTGAAGSIGSELVRQAIKYGPKAIVLFEQAESPLHELRLELQHNYPDQYIIARIGDVRNREKVEEAFKEFRPHVVYHAAAYKHVPLMEEHPNEAILANVMGTKNLADMAIKYSVERFVMISTDKAVNPTNIMGASKRIAEMYVQSLFKKLQKEDANCTKFITTRFGNVLGSNGSVIPYFKKQIAEGGPVTVTHPDIIRYFMTIPEACCLVMEASTLGDGGEIFVFDMGHAVKIYDLAKNMIRLAGLIPEKDIPIVFTGLRPGEKLYEELLNQRELTLPTQNEKIMIAQVREFDFDELGKKIDTLIDLSHQDKPFLTVAQMKDIVPEFLSKNSIYEQLDK